MDTVNNYFKKYTDKISFMELKDNKAVNIEGYEINDDIPLPILTEDLVQEIKEGRLEEEVKMSNIIDGIIYMIGIDNHFKYIEEYKNILTSYSKDIEEYIFYKGIRLIEKEHHDIGAICFRTLKEINSNNTNGIFNYALALETIGKSYFANEDEEMGIEFITQSTKELEYIIDIDKSYALAYYKLGYHYKFYQQYLKAKLIWNKYLLLDEDELRLQEIRIELENMESEVVLEAGLTYLTKADFHNALDQFLKLLPNFEKWWELNYFIGSSYKGLGEYKKAIEFFEIALEENVESSEVYNELGISHLLMGEIDKGINVFSEGIKNIQDDYKLLFNRGLGYIQLNKIEEAYEDISKALELNPEDKNILLQKQRLEEILR